MRFLLNKIKAGGEPAPDNFDIGAQVRAGGEEGRRLGMQKKRVGMQDMGASLGHRQPGRW